MMPRVGKRRGGAPMATRTERDREIETERRFDRDREPRARRQRPRDDARAARSKIAR